MLRKIKCWFILKNNRIHMCFNFGLHEVRYVRFRELAIVTCRQTFMAVGEVSISEIIVILNKNSSQDKYSIVIGLR